MTAEEAEDVMQENFRYIDRAIEVDKHNKALLGRELTDADGIVAKVIGRKADGYMLQRIERSKDGTVKLVGPIQRRVPESLIYSILDEMERAKQQTS
jgi:hypothetical protein